MNGASIAALCAVGVCFVGAIVYLVRNRGKGCSGCPGCPGGCAGCARAASAPKNKAPGKRSGKNAAALESAEPEAASETALGTASETALGTAAEAGKAPSAGFAESARRAEENRGTGERRPDVREGEKGGSDEPDKL